MTSFSFNMEDGVVLTTTGQRHKPYLALTRCARVKCPQLCTWHWGMLSHVQCHVLDTSTTLASAVQYI